MAIYIQTPDGLYPIGGQTTSGKVTKSKIIEALGYTPSAFDGDYNSLNNKPDIIEDGSDELTIIDTQGNIIFKVDSNGIHSVNLTLDGKTINELIQESTPNVGDGTSGADGEDGADGADGEDGREVELQVSSTHIQWRYVGDSSWTNLVSLADLKGDTGATGPSGTLNTNNTTSLFPSSNESLAESVSLHKVSKTGNYNDLKNKPEILDDESDELSIVDSQGNIVARITSEGIQAVNFLVGADEVALAKDISSEYELTKTKIETALGGSSTQLGQEASAEGINSIAIGKSASSLQDSSTALGKESSAEGFHSTALGSGAKASGSSSTALGNNTVASGSSSTALGQEANSPGNSSIALGSSAYAPGNYSIAFGVGARAEGLNSIAIGNSTEVTEDNVVDFGSARYVRVKETPLHNRDAVSKKHLESVNSSKQDKLTAGDNITIDENNRISASGGIETVDWEDVENKPALQDKLVAGTNITIDENNRISATGEIAGTVDWQDVTNKPEEYELTKIKINTVLEGDGDSSIQLGLGNSSGGEHSVAIGRFANAGASSAVALGTQVIATGVNSIAIGLNTKATHDFTTALGNASEAGGTASTALGYNAKTGSSVQLMQLGAVNLSTLQANVQLTVTSDIRDKTDIVEVPKALDFIKDLNPITYVANDRDHYISEEQKETDTYKDYLMVEDYDRDSHSQGTKKGARRRVGLSAQEVRDKLIEHYGSDNYANVVNDNFVEFEERDLDIPKGLENKLTMSYETMVPFLIKAIQEQQEQIEELKKQINKDQ